MIAEGGGCSYGDLAMSEGPRPRHRWFAAMYDRMDRDDAKTLALRKRLLRGVGGSVLEIGCGTGKNFEHYEWGGIESLEAAEPDPFMLERAQEKLDGMNEAVRSRVRLSEAPAEALPFGDGVFDVVVSCLVLCTVEDPGRSLSEARRVLKPGGELRLLEHVAAEGGWRRVQGAIQPVYGWMSAGCRLDRETEGLVAEAGFDLEVWERVRFSPVHPGFIGVGRRV
jgi:ubiquinone/menaquinone biosynthesis C-methylase UbiE